MRARMENTRSIPPISRAHDTVEALRIEYPTPHGWVFWLFAAAAASLLIALPLVRVAVTVRAPGILRPIEMPVEVRAPASGALAEVFVEENATVAANQPLFEIASPEADERLRNLRRRADELENLVRDLAVLTERSATDDLIAGDDDAVLITPLYCSERARLRSLLASAAVERVQLARERERAEQLHSRRLISDQDRDTAQHAVARLDADRAATIAQTLAGWQTERHRHEDELVALRGDERELLEAKTRRLVRAPVAGDLIGFTGCKPGVFVAEGQMVAAISPPGALRVETNVRSRDLALLEPGLPARIEIDAYPATEWGSIEGGVESIDRDVRWSEGAVSRRMIVGLRSEPGTGSSRTPLRLQKGMAATVRIVVGRRSLWHYLTETTDRWLEEGTNISG